MKLSPPHHQFAVAMALQHHRHTASGGGIGGDRTGRGMVSEQPGLLQDPAPQGKQV